MNIKVIITWKLRVIAAIALIIIDWLAFYWLSQGDLLLFSINAMNGISLTIAWLILDENEQIP
jgi:hypothetical protein